MATPGGGEGERGMANLDGQMTLGERIAWCDRLFKLARPGNEAAGFLSEFLGLEAAREGLELPVMASERCRQGYQDGINILKVMSGLDSKRSDG